MTRVSKVLMGVLAAGLGTVYAQVAAPPAARPPVARATISDPEGPVPRAASVPLTLPKDIKWTGEAGHEQTAIGYGDPTKGALRYRRLPRSGRHGPPGRVTQRSCDTLKRAPLCGWATFRPVDQSDALLLMSPVSRPAGPQETIMNRRKFITSSGAGAAAA